MARSISARIFTGFVAVIVAFGAVMAFTVYGMHELRQQLVLTNKTYLPLMLIGSELHYTQGRLNIQIAERAAGRSTIEQLRHHIKVARKYRIGNARRGVRLIRRAERARLPAGDARFLAETRRALSAAIKTFRADEALFEQLFSTARTSAATLHRIGANLLRGERKLDQLTATLRRRLRGQMEGTVKEIVGHQRTAVTAGLGLVVLALTLSLVVTVRARRLLSPLKTLVKSAKRSGAGDYAGRAPVESRDELGALAEEFNSMAAAVQERETRLIRSERMAAAGQLASHITHEVRNPLNSISLNTEILEEELASISAAAGDAPRPGAAGDPGASCVTGAAMNRAACDAPRPGAAGDPGASCVTGAAVNGASGAADEARTICRAIRKEVDRLTEITEEYLQFARLPKPSLRDEDINEILAGLLGFIGGELEGHGVTVETDLADGLSGVPADENQLRQAFLNLMRNATDAMADGKGTLRVETRVVDGSLEVTVADTGAGIEPAAIERIFEPFFSTKRGGTGLGLALTHQIVQEHGGEISVESDLGVGTTFTVRLPVNDTRRA